MFCSGSLIRTYFSVNGFDFCVDTAVIMDARGKFDFETMLFRTKHWDADAETATVFEDSFDELHALTFEEAKNNHKRMVNRYTVPFCAVPSADDYSGIDRVIKELSADLKG